jgi:hypothetical protein
VTLLNPDALDAYGTGRASPLLPGYAAIHADLHNHTQLSDGRGDPAKAFASMRDAGLDAAAITDHTNLPGMEGDWEPSSLDEPGWEQLRELAAAADRAGEFVAIRGLYDWLETEEAGQALASFNHPGSRGTVLRFGDFILRAPLLPRMVGLEMFNKTDDYLFAFNHEGVSPLVQCLDAGWRPGLIGVTDEHGANWGQPEGKGRTGLLVNELSRAGIRDALASRRSFASRVKGLRLVATLGGALMGQRLRGPVSAGPVELAVDLELGPMAVGTELSVQLLRWSRDVPVVEEVGRVTSGDGVFRTHVEVDPDEPWIVLRVTDPAGRAGGGTPWRHVELGRSIAYASPWWIAAE